MYCVYISQPCHYSVSSTWPTISGMPRARSISCRAITSAVLSRESSWSKRARSSLWPSLCTKGPSSSSRGCVNWSLNQQMIGELKTENNANVWHLSTNLRFTIWRDRVKGLPVGVALGSVYSNGRVWPGGGLRWGPMSTKWTHTHIGFTSTCRQMQTSIHSSH